MSEKAERVCAAILGISLVLDFILVMAIEGGGLTGVAAGLSVAAVLLLQLTTMGYIKKNWKKEDADGTMGRE